MINITPKPDFSRFRQTLLLQKAYRRPPLFDFHVDPSHKAAVIGRPVATATDEVEFWTRAGYDYVQCTLFVPQAEMTKHQQRETGQASRSSDDAVITSLEQFRSRRWSWQDAADGDLAGIEDQLENLRALCRVLPPEMKLLLHTADIFTSAWIMIGFTTFCIKSIEEPELIAEVMGSLAKAQINAMKAGLAIAGDKVGALFYSDDIAYTEGLMMGPDFYGRELFPYIRQIVELGRSRDLPLIYHTDGRLYDVFDQLAEIGVRGVQPLEPKSMDPLEIKRRWPGRFCLMGNIDLDLLGRGETDAVERHVRQRVATLNQGGGYMPGVSNTVPYYVKYENYKRMIETVYSLEE